MAYKDAEDARSYDREYKKKYRAKNPGRNNEYQAAYKRERYANDPEYRNDVLTYNKRLRATASYMVRGAKKRAAEKKVPFTLNKEHISQIQTIIDRGQCELSGLAFQRIEGDRHPHAPSLDRIKPELGYVPGNVRVILWCLNAAMGDWGLEVLLTAVRAIVDANRKSGV